MRTAVFLLAAGALSGCGGDPGDSGTETVPTHGGQCGAVEEYDILIRASVVDTDGLPVAGAEIRVVEDSWHQPEEVWSSAITDATGVGEFLANNIVAVEDCWGTAVNYHLVAQLGDTFGEDKSYNSSLFTAINDGAPYVADTTGSPLVLQ